MPNRKARGSSTCGGDGNRYAASPRRSPDPEPLSLTHSEAHPRELLNLNRNSSSSSYHCERPSVDCPEDLPSPLICPRYVTGLGAQLNRTTTDKPSLIAQVQSQPNGSAGIDITARQNATYCHHWSQVVLGATSAIMFLLVLCVCYALYVLVAPYGQSIVNGVLLSIVMHPQSRLRSALYMDAAVDRMTGVQRRWAVRGRLMGLIGTWLSLHHFASFVVMQGMFFLGINKIHVHKQSMLLRGAPVNGPDAKLGVEGAGTASPPSHNPQDVVKLPQKSSVATKQRGGIRGSPLETAAPTYLKGSLGSLPSTVIPPSRHRQRLVTTRRGRRILRWLTISIIVSFAHLLIGVTYFLLLHVVLGFIFAITVPFLSTNTFVISMGRLWRVAVILFFVVGITLNATADVLSISEAVRRTTSAVVGSGSGGDADMGALSVSNTHNVHLSGLGVEHGSASGPAASKMTVTEGDRQREVDAGREAGTAATATVLTSMDSLNVLNKYRSHIEDFLVSKIQDLFLQELADITSDGNVSQMIETLMVVFPPHLRSVVTRSDAVLVGGGSSPDKDSASPLSRGEGEEDTHEKMAATPFSWSAMLAYARDLHPASAVKSLVYDFLPGMAAGTRDGLNDTKLSSMVAAGYQLKIDWLTVFRLIASRLLPYVDYALRVFFRVGANLLGFFDTIYSVMLFVFFYRYLTHLKHTVLYYGVAKLLRVMQPELGDYHARSIEKDITVSFITLLQSYWHLTWFHFCITFCVFRLWGFPIPFFLGLVSVILALFPLVPKWLSPCSIALVYMLVQLALLTTCEETNTSDSGSRPGEVYPAAAATVAPFLFFQPGRSWIEVLVWGKPYVLHYTRVLSFGLAVLLECGDEWLLCVSRGLYGSVDTHAPGNRGEPLQPFVIGTSLVLGFVAYGTYGIVFGPLTVIVARVLFDNWDIVLASREPGCLSIPRPSLVGLDGEDDEGEVSMME